MYPATVTRFFFYFIWTLFLHPQVIKSVNSIDQHIYQLSRLKRSPQEEGNDVAWEDVEARSEIGSSENTSDEETRTSLETLNDESIENARREAAPSSSENTAGDETRRAADTSHEDSDEETINTINHNENIIDDSYDEGRNARTSFWRRIMDSAIQRAMAPLNLESNKETRRPEGGLSLDEKSIEETRKAAVISEESPDNEIRRHAGPSSNQHSSDETRRAASTSDENTDDETKRQAVFSSNEHSNEEIRKVAIASGESPDDGPKRHAASSSNEHSNEERRIAAVVSEESPDDGTRRLVGASSNEHSNEERGRTAVISEESPDDGTRRLGGASSNEHSNEEIRRAAVISEESPDDGTRRLAGASSNEHSNEEMRRSAVISEENPDAETREDMSVVVVRAGSVEHMTNDEVTTGKDAANLEGTSNRGTRRFQKHINFNQNVNTNINSNVQIDPMDFPRDEEYRPHYRPDANLQRYIPDDILEKLHTCDIFRDNIIFVMGYLLRLPDGLLSIHEYSSLEMIYNAMKAKSIYMYNLLPTLNFLRDKSLSQQFAIVLNAIGQNLPSYMKSAPAFWIKRINDRKVNLDSFLSQSSETNILAGISDQAFVISRLHGSADEMVGYDEGSQITADLMGPIYVTIFRQLNQMKKNFSQSLFGTIVRDLPNTDCDPVFEEYVRYIAEETWNDKIPNWSKHCRALDAQNPYALVVSLVDEICADAMVSLQMKKAFLYIRHHFTDSGRKVLRNVVRDTRTITENGLNIDMLFKVVVPYQTDDIDEMKFRLRGYLLPSPDKDVTRILAGINRFKYNTPTDLLLAFLARLQMRLAPTNDIQVVASALLSNLLFPTTVKDVSIPENGAIAFWVIVDSIVEPDTNDTIRSLVTSLQLSLFNDLKGWDKIHTQLLPSRNECTYPRKCLLTILDKFKIILDGKLSLLPKDIAKTVNQLSDYVSINLEEKNSPRPCFDTPVPVTIPSVTRHYVPRKTTTKLPKTTTKPPQTENKQLQTTFKSLISSSESLAITRKPPNKMTALSKLPPKKSIVTTKTLKLTKPAKITTEQPTVTTKSPKEMTRQSKITSEESEIITTPAKKIAGSLRAKTKPSKVKVNPSESTTTSSIIISESSEITTKLPKMGRKLSKKTTMSSKISAQSTTTATRKRSSKFDKTTSKSLKITLKPTKVPPTKSSKMISKSRNLITKAPKLTSRTPEISPKLPKATYKTPNTTPRSKLSSKPTKTSPTTQKILKPPRTTTIRPMRTTTATSVTKPLKLMTKLPKSTSKPSKVMDAFSIVTTTSPKKASKSPETITKLPKITTKTLKTTPNPLITTVQQLKTTTKLPKLAIKPSKPMDEPLKPTSQYNNSFSKSPLKSTAEPAKSAKPMPNSSPKKSDKSPSTTGTTILIERPRIKKINNNISSIYTSLAKRSMLPPNMNSKDCIIFDIKSKKLTILPFIYTKANVSNVPASAIIFPSMTELHDDIHHDNGIVENVNEVCVEQLKTKILSAVNETVGGSYESQLLGKNWRENYPTRISALMGILESGLRHPKIIATTALRNDIGRYRDGLQFIGPYIYLPMLSCWKKFEGEIVWSSIDLNSDDFSIIANSPPKEIEKNVVTLPLINPSYWVLPIDTKDGDPFPNLLPRLQANSTYAKKLKPLIDIFTHEKIKTAIGHSINFSRFPNRGALFIYTLIQLKHSKTVQQNGPLLKLINKYLNILQRPAMYIRIPEEVIADEQYDVHGGWTVDTVDLMELLPKPKSPADTKLYESMRSLLSKPNLLSELKIPIPPMETTKGFFMKIIIDKALQTKNITRNNAIKKALKYYQDKFDSNNRGRMNLGWIWSQKFIVSTEMHLGELIEELLPYKELSSRDQKAYDDLVVYFNNHPHFLNTHSMPLTEYKTRGAFLRGFFVHLLEESALDKKVKEKVKKLLASVKMTGEGAKSMPPLARRAMPIIQPTWE